MYFPSPSDYSIILCGAAGFMTGHPSFFFVGFIITHMFWFSKGYLWDFAQIAVKFQAIDIFLTFFAIFRQCSTLYDISHTFRHHFLRCAAQYSLRNGAVFFLCKLPLPSRFPVKIHRKPGGKRFFVSGCLHCHSACGVMQGIAAWTAAQRLRRYPQGSITSSSTRGSPAQQTPPYPRRRPCRCFGGNGHRPHTSRPSQPKSPAYRCKNAR